MFSLDILNFLSPISSDKIEELPIIFFSVILIISLTSVFCLIQNAKEKSWQQNWDKKQLDAEHSSITDLSYAVATKSENAADVLPGIILIIGLLGTFIGLGLALDKASIILGNANMDMDSSMGQLMKMMEGLGTKFKTSTWGLIAFLLLKMIGSKNGYEERRLHWCTQKIKHELEQKHQNKMLFTQQENGKLLDSIELLAERLISHQSQMQQDNQRLMNEISTQKIAVINEHNNKVYEQNNVQHLALLDTFKTALQENGKMQIKAYSENHNVMIKQAQTQHNKLIELIKHTSAENIKNQNNQTQRLIENFEKNNLSIISSKEEIKQAIESNSNYLNLTAQESKNTRQAIEKFVDENLKTIDNLKQSATDMSKASKTMGESAGQLQEVINSLNKEMTLLLEMLKSDLGTTIDNMDKSFNKNMGEMTQNLASTIEDMNVNFKQNMNEMAQGLNKATEGISNAVAELSHSVDNTMNNVSSTIKESMDLQKKAQTVFVDTSDNLNEQIIAMTELVNKLKDDITQGLQAVSDSNRNVASLNKKSMTSTEQIEALIKSVNTLSAPISDIQVALLNIAKLKPLLEAIKQDDATLNAIKNMEKGLRDLVEVTRTLNIAQPTVQEV